MTAWGNIGVVAPNPTEVPIDLHSYQVVGTSAGYKPPLVGQLWPRGDMDGT